MSQMDTPPQNKKEGQIDMEAFRKEMVELIVAKGNIPTETVMNLAELTETGAEIWYKIKNYTRGLVTKADF